MGRRGSVCDIYRPAARDRPPPSTWLITSVGGGGGVRVCVCVCVCVCACVCVCVWVGG